MEDLEQVVATHLEAERLRSEELDKRLIRFLGIIKQGAGIPDALQLEHEEVLLGFIKSRERKIKLAKCLCLEFAAL